MAYNVIVRDEAYSEALEAYLYYEEKQEGLGERFLAAVQILYKQLATNPDYYIILTSDKKKVLRDVKLKDFPFVIIFEIRTKDVFVYAVHNTHKDLPKKFIKKK